MLVATLVAPWEGPVLTSSLVQRAKDALQAAGARVTEEAWLEPERAADLFASGLTRTQARAVVEDALAGEGVDVIVQEAAHRRRKLLIADMDSTMITIECIDELADYAGVKEQVARVTEAAMRGELDFEGALDARVSLLEELEEAVLERCYAERVTFTPGGAALVKTMAANGAHTVLVSGGFTFFVERVAAKLGFAQHKANVLGILDGKLTGKVDRPIITASVKRQTLLEEAAHRGISLDACLAVGDGANDIPMIEEAGLGVAFHAKPKTEAAASASIRHGDLTALLFAQGYRREDWEAAR
ncbi:phosphoserine phosphatase SerB [Pedomonas mirosovicensis]|uniref:phosphoserine phosphatase SerB n=1 Tax=Pedomonas mirosovicensis TaxID=2908641 RepID=UPI002169290A|nr:phosphoserine phosphatase SerB [Pedomonas mirosovicensis]MCH8684888.1 phosphoserine phosphatase SerB [Pedomonas mirosovicensis]